ncbi:hypothetical protein CPB84DRAFT_1851646 [Gymnopilus junonius]|uniref:CAP-Gly domain-containing protein n=1 Tax=Gymnopilus junonius TaxID=109634 RepID=A0A9P5NCY1_GYMJU|nr:hypothetical protein CPB84DRAFT_1851646 [Gymnopilus junonius]
MSHPVSVVLSTSSTTPLPPPGLQEATKRSTESGRTTLNSCSITPRIDFRMSFGSLAPPSFQNRYFALRPNGATSPLPSSPYPGESALSLGLETSMTAFARTPSPNLRSSSPSNTLPAPTSSSVVPTTSSTLLRLTTSMNPTVFSNELEFLYTGKGFGEAFEFLFDEAREHTLSGAEGDDDPDMLRIDKLRKDLVFMWRSRLYSDVRISLSGNFGGGSHESTTAIFSSHRFILVSRSSYFSDQLTWPTTTKALLAGGEAVNEPPTITLPSPPFTPASTYDLSTAFAILKAALYLDIPTLHDEIQARIVQEMMHGLFHAFITFSEYESLTGGKWGTGGCRCRQCARRAPRVLEFSLEEDVRNLLLERGARRALVGMFGEGWCTQEFASLSPKLREGILKGVSKRTTPMNVFPLLFAAEHALGKLQTTIDAWADGVREMILQARKGMEEVLVKECEKCFGSAEEEGEEEWMEIMKSDGVRFEDGERVEWVMAAVLRALRRRMPGCLSGLFTLVSSILLRPHPTEPTATLLAATSHVRVQVEQTRLELLKWIGKRWLVIRQEKGFDPLEGWALKEISDHIEVPIEDLLSPPIHPPNRGSGSPSSSSPSNRPRQPNSASASSHNPLLRPISNHPHTSKIDAESDAGSSMRVSVLSRSIGGATPARSARTTGGSAARSVHSLASSVMSRESERTVSTARHPGHHVHGTGHSHGNGNNGGLSPAKQLAADVRAGRARSVSGGSGSMKDRPDSKLLPSSSSFRQPSIIEPHQEEEDDYGDGESRDVTIEDGDGDKDSLAGGDYGDEEDKSDVGDDRSVGEEEARQTKASDASSVYHTPGPLQKTLITRASLDWTPKHLQAVLPRIHLSVSSSANRPVSTLSSATDRTETTTSFKTASSGLSTPVNQRSRKTSAASTVSVKTASGAAAGRPTGNSPVNERSRKISSTSVSSVASTTGSVRSVKSPATGVKGKATPVKRVPSAPTGPVVDPGKLSPASATAKSPRLQTSKSAGSASVSAGPVRKPGVMDRKKSTESLASRKSLSVVAKPTAPMKSRANVSVPPSPSLSVPPALPSKDKVGDGDVVMKDGEEKLDEKVVPKDEQVVPNDADDKENVVPDVHPDASPTLVPPTSQGRPKSIVHDVSAEEPLANTSSTFTIRPPIRPVSGGSSGSGSKGVNEHRKTDSAASVSSIATLTGRRRGSGDTLRSITGSSTLSNTLLPASSTTATSLASISTSNQLPQQQQPLLSKQPSQPLSSIDSLLASDTPRGATLEIGIPCIISSKRKRFKAYARYIGEVVGETGSWVGVEVPLPVADSWGDGAMGDSKMKTEDDRQWNDGSWCGIRYFEINGGVGGSEWEYGEEGGRMDRPSRRRRLDGGSYSFTMGAGGAYGSAYGAYGMGKGLLKREGDQLSISSERMKRMRSVSPAVSDMSGTETRGLFVRPQQVLYVVDAVGSDL